MMLRVFVFWCYSLVVAGCLRVTISNKCFIHSSQHGLVEMTCEIGRLFD